LITNHLQCWPSPQAKPSASPAPPLRSSLQSLHTIVHDSRTCFFLASHHRLDGMVYIQLPRHPPLTAILLIPLLLVSRESHACLTSTPFPTLRPPALVTHTHPHTSMRCDSTVSGAPDPPARFPILVRFVLPRFPFAVAHGRISSPSIPGPS
jgi:hypothetical protein